MKDPAEWRTQEFSLYFCILDIGVSSEVPASIRTPHQNLRLLFPPVLMAYLLLVLWVSNC